MNDFMTHEPTDISLYRGALNYFAAIKIIHHSGERCPSDAFGFLASHSLELALKSFLLNKGLAQKELKKIGHDLVKSWDHSVKLGLPIDSTVPKWCELLNNAHSKQFLFRYSETNTGLVTPNKQHLFINLEKIVTIAGNEIGLDSHGNFV